MDLSNAILGRRDFYSKNEIIAHVSKSIKFDPAKEDLSKATALLIFRTSNQQTWIVSTHERLYCILDDVRKDEPRINWSDEREKHVDGTSVITEIRTRNKSDSTGLVDIGAYHRNWLYSKNLFGDESIEDSIKKLIANFAIKPYTPFSH